MYWKIRFRVNKLADSPISTIRIDANNLRDACSQVLSLYRMATILDYQQDSGEVKRFELSDIGAKSYPIDPNMFSVAK
ncbi:hypothetical protein [Polynucleobacter sp. UB-Piko-W3]|jgi:hypothetical protein|uniref:hypothetical protein n=1 Tax=Polynucleobacter sp. UB-Piko-W3 TaxID=1819735 RepID=UPI001C0C6F87|nr:hypothetical protein [Polynucleobacter sp. UB-Piko-W3]MBU3555668.1 hypothetical protein [Polynucleobacter sp. UB-Piko-W3]